MYWLGGNVGIRIYASVNVNGITKTQKLQLGNKWLLSGVGDAHVNDDWLRLFPPDAQGEEWYGGFAAGKLYSKEGFLMDQTFA